MIALAPEMAGHAGAVKRELIVSRIAQGAGTQGGDRIGRIWKSCANSARKAEERDARPAEDEAVEVAASRQGRAAPEERQLLEILLAEPALVAPAAAR